MTYQLGVDLGTTYTAAAVSRDGRVEVVTLGATTPTMPTLAFLRDDGEILVGEAAARRGTLEATRLAREFKRRLGDPAPIVLAGTPFAPETLMGHVLRAVLQIVTEREGEQPDRLVLTHPATYGPFKLDMMGAVVRVADVDPARTVFLSEPEAAALNYAGRHRVEVGEVVAVYDFGGGTFDAALVRRSADGFAIIGRPEGIDRFGGIDVDAAILAHVDDELDGLPSAADPNDPAVREGLVRLRDDCRTAKETLSGDTDAAISVWLPGVHTQVRITRGELESMVRPRIKETVDVLERAVRSADLEMADVSRILLVGGSSRMPLVAEMVAERTGRPVANDAHPKFAVASGAAAWEPPRSTATPTTVAPPPVQLSAPPPVAPAPPAEPPAFVAPPPVAPPRTEPSVPPRPAMAAPSSPPPSVVVGSSATASPKRRRTAVLAGALAVVGLTVGIAIAVTRGDDPKDSTGTTPGDTVSSSPRSTDPESTDPIVPVVSVPVVDGGPLAALVADCTAEAQVNLIALPDEWANYKGIIQSFNEKYPGVATPVANPDASSRDEEEAVKALAGQADQPDSVDVSPAVAQSMVDQGLFEPYVASVDADIPAGLKDADNNWYMAYYGVMTITTNTTIVPNAPLSFSDLTKPEYQGLLAVNDPRVYGAGFGAVVAAALANGGTADNVLPGIQFFADLKASGNLSDAEVTTESVTSGATPISLDWSFNAPSLQGLLASDGLTSVTAFPADSSYGSGYAQGVINGSPHQACGRLWTEHLLSDEGALGYIGGGAVPARYRQLLDAGKVPEASKQFMPPDDSVSEMVVLSPAQLEVAKQVVADNWGPMVADA